MHDNETAGTVIRRIIDAIQHAGHTVSEHHVVDERVDIRATEVGGGHDPRVTNREGTTAPDVYQRAVAMRRSAGVIWKT